MDTVHSEIYKNHRIRIVHDQDAESPREWDNLGIMAFFHKRYNLGDKHKLTVEDAQEIAESNDYISLPVYMYDHSGITINTSGFVQVIHSCPWDSGQLGIIYCSWERARKEYTGTDEEIRKQVIKCLNAEVKVYDMFLTGQCYGFEIETECTHCNSWKHVDSCFGFLGSYDGDVLAEAKHLIDYLTKDNTNESDNN